MGVLVGGTAGAQLLLVAASPILTRFYSPQDFGLLAVFSGLLSLIGIVASARYELAIPLPKSADEAANVAGLSLLIVFGTALLTMFAVFFFDSWIGYALGVPELASYSWLLPLGVLASGTYNVLNYWSTREKHFNLIARTRIRQAATTIVIQLSAFKLGGGALVFAHVAGQSVGTVSLAKPIVGRSTLRAVRWRSVLQAAIRFRRFPLLSTWAALFNTGGSQLPPLLFATLFGPVAAGLYVLANRVLSLPMSVIGAAIAQVFLSNAPKARREGRLGPVVADLHGKLAHIGLPPAIVLALTGPDLFGFVFGSEWKQAGEFAQWMAPWLYLAFSSSPISTLFAVMEKQSHALVFQAMLLAVRLLAILHGASTGDIMTTVALFSILSAACYFVLLIWTMFLSGNHLWAMFSPMANALFIGWVCALPIIVVYALEEFNVDLWLGALVGSLLLIGIRYVHLFRKGY